GRGGGGRGGGEGGESQAQRGLAPLDLKRVPAPSGGGGGGGGGGGELTGQRDPCGRQLGEPGVRIESPAHGPGIVRHDRGDGPQLAVGDRRVGSDELPVAEQRIRGE